MLTKESQEATEARIKAAVEVLICRLWKIARIEVPYDFMTQSYWICGCNYNLRHTAQVLNAMLEAICRAKEVEELAQLDDDAFGF